MASKPAQRLRLQKLAVFLAALSPLVLLAVDALRQDLGANPVEAMTHRTGDWALRLLLLTLAVTPLRKLFGWRRPLLFRRMLGLFAFAYAFVHFAVYAVFDQSLTLADTAADIAKRPFITVGFAALVLMTPLALTSTHAMMKRLGPRRWRLLHKLAYLCALLGVVHFWWLVKADVTEPAAYAAAFAVVVALRLLPDRRSRAAPTPA
jgi:sulfoxide reductase heme-binding subunit YedZ